MRPLLATLLVLTLLGCGSDSSDDSDDRRDAGRAPDAAGAHDAAAPEAGPRDANVPEDAAGSDASVAGRALCLLPFEPGPCEAYFPVFTYDAATNRCVPAVYGGCMGNENRFDTEAACLEACGCPEGHVLADVCKACGPAGGCAERVVECVPRCEDGSDCAALGSAYTCREGHCEIVGCI